MPIELPDPNLILQTFPQIKSLAHIETGRFKAVYKAEISGKTEALKLLQIPGTDNTTEAESSRKEFIGRIEREVLALQKCQVTELVKLGSMSPQTVSFSGKGYFLYSEEFISGANLWTLIKANGAKPNEPELRQLFVSILKAINELWKHGYIHRDIKPCNIIKSDYAKRPFVLLDLGIAFSITETPLTFDAQNRLPPATYRYLAPEMMDPNFRQNIDYRSDLYNTALSVYEYACFQHPLAQSQDDLIKSISRAIRQQPTPLKMRRQDLSEELCQLIDQMLKKKPALRPSNISGIIKKLEEKI